MTRESLSHLGTKFINTSPKCLKYPSGKKDGNKLGKRKRKLFYYVAWTPKGAAVYDKVKDIVYMHHEDYEAFILKIESLGNLTVPEVTGKDNN